MAQNIIVGIFEVESEGYQALTELKQNPGSDKYILSQAALTKKENGTLRVLDGFDTGVTTVNDTAMGGLLGACLGVLGGPIGVLLGGSYGALVGSMVDTGDALVQASLIEQIMGKMQDGEVVLIALAAEAEEAALNEKLAKFKTTIVRFDAAVVAEEVEEARLVEAEMARQARAALRKEKTAEFKNKVAERRLKIDELFEECKNIRITE